MAGGSIPRGEAYSAKNDVTFGCLASFAPEAFTVVTCALQFPARRFCSRQAISFEVSVLGWT